MTGPEIHTACGLVQAGNLGAGDYSVTATGNLTIHAGIGVELWNGLSVAGSLSVAADY